MVNKLIVAICLILAVGVAGGRHRRHLDSWLTDEQKNQLKDLQHTSTEYKTKVSKFYALLPIETQQKWDKVYGTKCFGWTSKVQTDDEEADFKELIESKNVEAVKERINELKEELGSEHRALVDLWLDDCMELIKRGVSRKRREIDAAFKDYLGWLTEDQKAAIGELKASGKSDEIKAKIKEFFGQLPADKQSTLKEEFKGKCKAYFTPLLTPEEAEKIQTLKNDHAAAGALIKGVVDRQTGDAQTIAAKMFEMCGEVFKNSRKRREIDAAFKDYLGWLTTEQKATIGELKASGKSDEIKAKIKEFFGQLPADKQNTLKEEFKGKCKAYFTPLLTPEETEKIQTLKNDHAAAGALIKGVVDRQTGDAQTIAAKMFEMCGEVFKNSRKRREIDAALKDFGKWMTADQKAAIGELKASGKSSDEIKAKVKEFFGQLPADQQATLKEDFKGTCRTYFKPLLTEEEAEKIKSANGDKTTATAVIRGVVERQTGDARVVAGKMFDICGEVYKDASRKRREIDAAFKDYLGWLTADQKAAIGELKASGGSSDALKAKIKEFFGQLPAEKQATLKEEFKGKCKAYFSPLLTADETAKLETLKGDKVAIGALIKEVVDRQTGDAQTIAAKMFEMCGEVFKDSSRKRREIDAVYKDFSGWMTSEQKTTIEELKAAGKSSDDIRAKVKEFFGQLPADKQSTLTEEFKGTCKAYFSPLLNAEEAEKIKTLKDDKAAAGALIRGVVDRQTGDAKVVAGKMFGICGEVYKTSSRKRREIDAAFKDYLEWMTTEQKAAIGELKASGGSSDALKAKFKEFFGQLPAEKQATLKEEFKGKCKAYFTPLFTTEEAEKVQTLKGDKSAIRTLIKGVVDRQTGETQTIAAKMFEMCGEIFKDSSRKRREIDAAFKDFAGWMTIEQTATIGELKAAGKSSDEIKAKVKEFFEQLPADQQVTLKEEFKGKCKKYFEPLLTSEEAEKIKTLAIEDKTAARALIKTVVDRQTGDVKVVAEKMFGLCGEVFKSSSRKMRRDVRQKIEKHLAWLRPEEKETIIKMTNEGKSKEEIKNELYKYIALHEKDSSQKEATIKKCYSWMDEIATKEEIENLHKLHHVDHNACKEKVREFISRLSPEKQESVQASLPFCEKLWYGDHDNHKEHNHDHQGHEHHHHRRRRHLEVIKNYIDWMNTDQHSVIEKMEHEGVEFTKISEKIREFFYELSSEKQSELKSNFKTRCLTWAKEVSKPMEWEEIKKYYKESEWKSLKDKLIELEERLTENQKHTIEHVRGICYRLWAIPSEQQLF